MRRNRGVNHLAGLRTLRLTGQASVREQGSFRLSPVAAPPI